MCSRSQRWFTLLLGVLVFVGCNQSTSRSSPSLQDQQDTGSTSRDASGEDTGGAPEERRDTSDPGNSDVGSESDTKADTEPSATLGADCEEDADCRSGRCEAFGDTSICTTRCRRGGNRCNVDGLTCSEGLCTPSDYCLDEDGDGYGDGPGCKGTDCDDSNADVHPGADELCGNQIDDNCNGGIDEGFEARNTQCTVGKGICQRTGRLECSDDKLSLECSVEPGDPEEEICDGLDNDCNGQIDDKHQCKCRAGETQSCYTGSKETRNRGVCDDGTQTCQPDGTWGPCKNETLPSQETCDGLDNSCSGRIDDVDQDGDGFHGCSGVAKPDCDDNDPDVHPGATETCNGVDDNCNGVIDEGAENTYYLDNDGDGYGAEAQKVSACSPPANYVDKVGDCVDNNPDIYPGAEEVCNDIDDDCDAKVDEGLPTKTIYRDVDNDGYAASGARSRKKCLYDRDGDGTGETPPVGWTQQTGDCDDTDATVHPTAEELCDQKDNDCDGITDRWCGYSCQGQWPVSMPGNQAPRTVVGDFEQDGNKEIGMTNRTSGKLVDAKGRKLFSESLGLHYARRAGIFADVDRKWANSQFRLEWIYGRKDHLTFVRMTQQGPEIVSSNVRIHDQPQMMARDFDEDDRTEVFAGDVRGVVLAEYSPEKGTFVEQRRISTPDGKLMLTNGNALADIDGDPRMELIFGSGRSRNDRPSEWAGKIWAFSFDTQNRATRICKNCFDTSAKNLYAQDVGRMYVHDQNGDSTPDLYAPVSYAKTKQNNTKNPRWGWKLWNFDSSSGKSLGSPPKRYTCLKYDGNNDGKAECNGYGWRHDIDGDGDEDRVRVRNGRVHVERWENGTWQREPAGARASGGSIRWLGDLQGDGELEVLIQGRSKLQCYSFGKKTYHPWSSHGPPLDELPQRTFQRDNWEPNDTKSRAFRIFNEEHHYRGFLTTPNDTDWFEVGIGNGWCADVTVQAPDTHGLEVELYGAVDRNGDGDHDVIGRDTIQPGKRGRLSCRDSANSTSLGRYWVKIESLQNGSSTTSPYKLKASVNF